MRIDKLKRRRELDEEWCGQVVRMGKERNRREKWEKIIISRYNKWYEWKREVIPDYLKTEWGKVEK